MKRNDNTDAKLQEEKSQQSNEQGTGAAFPQHIPTLEEEEQQLQQELLEDIQSNTPTATIQSMPLDDQPPILPKSPLQKPELPAGSQSFIPSEETDVILDVKKEDARPIVILKPITVAKFRLGLQDAPEHYNTFPGTSYRWAPRKVGNLYRNGLNRTELAPTKEEREKKIKELEYAVGQKLDNEFYDTLSYKLDPNKTGGEKLDLNIPIQLIVYLCMLESDTVANGILEKRNGTKPLAEWYIENREAEVESEASLMERQQKAALVFKELSEEKKRNVAIIAGLDVMGVKGKVVDVELWKWVNKEVYEKSGKVTNVDLFLGWVEQGDAFINVSALVKNALRLNIIRKTSAGDFAYGDRNLGNVEVDVVMKLASPLNSDLRLGITTQVKNKLT